MNLDQVRQLFPVTKNVVYANHAAVGPISIRVKEAVDNFLKGYVNQGYLAGPEWQKLLSKARQNVAKLINATPSEIAFTSSTSQGLSFVAGGLEWKKGGNILVPDCEFPANVYPWLSLEKKGVKVKFIPSVDSKLSLDQIQKQADSQTRLLSISSVQYGSGWRAPLEELGNWCRSKNIFFCVDAIQSLGVIPMDVQKYKIDFLAADGHKWLLGPEGTALFYCSSRVRDKLTPNVIGWKSVENPLDFDHIHYTLRSDAQKFEAGSDNMLGIHALNASIELLLELGMDSVWKKVSSLTHHLIEQTKNNLPSAEIVSSEKPDERSGILAIKIPSDPTQIIEKLLKDKIYVSTREEQ